MAVLRALLEQLEAETAAGYKAGAEFYDRLYRLDKAFALAQWQDEQWLVDFVGSVRHSRVLDCMCGTGSPSLFLADALGSQKVSPLIVGVDASATMLARLRRNARGYGSLCQPPSKPVVVSRWSWMHGGEKNIARSRERELKVLRSEIHCLKQHFPPSFFDVVVVWGCSIQHLLSAQRWRAFLEDIKALLNPQGCLVFNTLRYVRGERGELAEVDEDKRMYRGSLCRGRAREHFLMVCDYYAWREAETGVIEQKTTIAVSERKGSVRQSTSASVWLNPLDEASIRTHLCNTGLDDIRIYQPRNVTQNWVARRSKVNG